MLEFLVDNILVIFARKVFQQTVVRFQMGIKLYYFPSRYLFYSYEAEFIQFLFSAGMKQQLGPISRKGAPIVHRQPYLEFFPGQMYPV